MGNETTERTIWVKIAAPDGQAALALERRLSHLRPTSVERRARWTVDLEDVDDRMGEVEAAVRQWLRERQLASTVITVDGVAHELVASR